MSTNIKALQLVKDKMGSSPNNVLRNLVVLIHFMDNNYWINSLKLCKILNKNEILYLEENEIRGGSGQGTLLWQGGIVFSSPWELGSPAHIFSKASEIPKALQFR